MKRRFNMPVTAALTLICVGLFTLASMAGETATGSISGKISVRGVRSPENVLVYVVKAPGKFPPPKTQAKLDQFKITFVPFLLPIVKGTTVSFENSDPILHNVMWLASKNGAYSANNLGTWGKGHSVKVKFDKEGELTILCNIHPEMEAHIVVLQNPFFAVVGKDGAYEIKGVPAGKYTVKTWYANTRRLKSKSADVTVTAGKATTLDFSLSRH